MKTISNRTILIAVILGSLSTAYAVEEATSSLQASKDKKVEKVEDVKLDFQKLESKTKDPELSAESLHQAEADAQIRKSDKRILSTNIDSVQELEKCMKLKGKEKIECRKLVFKKAQ